MRFREGLGKVQTIVLNSTTIQVYKTVSWDVEEKREGEATMLPVQYRQYWDQLNYISIYYAEVYKWFKRWLDDPSHQHEHKRPQIQAAMTRHAKYMVYCTFVRRQIQDRLKELDVKDLGPDRRIPVFNEWIVKDFLELHEGKDLAKQKKNYRRYIQMDPIADSVRFGQCINDFLSIHTKCNLSHTRRYIS